MVALGTRTLVEVATLATSAARLVRERGPVLVTWYCLGWTVHQGGLFGSALLGVQHVVLANLVFVLAVVAKLVTLVLLVHAVRPWPSSVAATGGADPAVPALVAQSERTVDVVTLAVGPFLAVYAVWGFLDDEVSALFRSNYVLLGLGDVQRWSISLSNERLPFYLGLAAAGWLLREGVRLVLRWRATRATPSRRRRPTTGLAGLGVLAEGVWSLSVFVVLIVVLRAVRGWLQERVVWSELSAAGHAALALVPTFELPFGQTARELARDLVTVAPGALATVLGLPLMWLALAATVYGWREVRAADVVVGTRAASGLERLRGLARTPVGRLLLLASGDLRTKYLPVAHALRLVGRAGPRVVGAYLLLATAIGAADNLLQIGVSLLVGPRSQAVTLLLEPAEDLLVSLPVTMVSVALYAAVFGRVLAQPAAQGRSTSVGPPPLSSSWASTCPPRSAGTTKAKPIGRGVS